MSFSAIKGLDRPIEILKAYIDNSRLEAGYLFTGPEGIGKRQVALALAKRLNCLEDKADACGHCSSCLKIDSYQHPDVHVISDDEPQIKIEVIRQLQKEMSLKAYEGRLKVFIIDNANKLTAEASNSLLKVLEEPSRGSLIILITDKPGLLFKTVVSRCKVVKFSPLKRRDLEEILRKDYKLDAGYSHFLAYFSEGRLGRALKLKDEDIINKKNSLIDKFILSSSRPVAESLASASRIDVRNSLNLLATWFRDIYIIKAGMDQGEVINSDRKQELALSASRLTFLDLDSILVSITNAISYSEKNVNTRLLLYNLRMELWKG
ncbi:MAG: DNA polymerase III subunit delta' [Candidatus Omnitrophota bacterium]